MAEIKGLVKASLWLPEEVTERGSDALNRRGCLAGVCLFTTDSVLKVHVQQTSYGNNAQNVLCSAG